MIRTDNISIITNFGCSSNCWYCIWKKHELLNNIQTCNNTDWNKLEEFISNNQNKGKVSISGGGDPLYKFSTNQAWWNKTFSILSKFTMLIDIHTREKLFDKSFWQKINRCCFSSDKLANDAEFLRYLTTLTKVRITHVVTAKTTEFTIKECINFCVEHNAQLSLKELAIYNDHKRFKELKNKYPNLIFLENKDYNTYFMPNNTIQTRFLK